MTWRALWKLLNFFQGPERGFFFTGIRSVFRGLNDSSRHRARVRWNLLKPILFLNENYPNQVFPVKSTVRMPHSKPVENPDSV